MACKPALPDWRPAEGFVFSFLRLVKEGTDFARGFSSTLEAADFRGLAVKPVALRGVSLGETDVPLIGPVALRGVNLGETEVPLTELRGGVAPFVETAAGFLPL